MHDKPIGELYGRAFERLLVWMVLMDKDFGARVVGRLDAALFSSAGARAVMQTVEAKYAESGARPSVAIVLADLRERSHMAAENTRARRDADLGVRYVRSMLKRPAPTSDEAAFIATKVRDFVTRRSVFSALERSIERFNEGRYEGIVEDMRAAVSEGDRAVAPSLGVEAYADAAQKMVRYRRRVVSARKFPLGVRMLDDATRGGMEPGKLAMFMGPTARGKTLALVNAAYSALAQGCVVAHVTLEIDAQEVEARYDARAAQAPINSFVSGAVDGKWARRIARAVRAVRKHASARLFIKEYSAGEATVRDLGAYLQAVRVEAGAIPDVVVVDYLDLLKHSGSADPEHTRFALADTTRALRTLAREHECAVWTASQTGRSSFAAQMIRPQDVAECIEKVNVADLIVGLCQTDSEKERGVARLALLKNRLGGQEGLVVDVIVNTKTQTITQSPAQVRGRSGAARR